MARFRFVAGPEQGQTLVYYRGAPIGYLESAKEEGGRQCFLLDCDPGPRRRQFRGRLQAAEALLVIHRNLQEWQQRSLTPRELIVRAWHTRPSGTGDSNLPSEKRKTRRTVS